MYKRQAVYCAMEGSRPVLCELQALCSTAVTPMPRRTGTGVDYSRMNMLLAVLEKKLGFKLYTQDVFINVAGGFRLDEPGSDLAMVCALVSSLRAQAVDKDLSLIHICGALPVIFRHSLFGGKLNVYIQRKGYIQAVDRL